MVEVELGGILEEKLRRLVELGLYSSLSEAVRDAIRRLLEHLDLRSIALKLYLNTNASFQYVTEFAEMSYDDMIEFLMSRGIVPLLGIVSDRDTASLDPSREYVLDPFTLYTMYRADMYKFLEVLVDRDYVFLAPSSISSWAEAIFFKRLTRYLEHHDILKFFNVDRVEVPGFKAKLTLHEQYAIFYATKHKNCILLSDDVRTREYARSLGVSSLSSISVLYTLREEFKREELEDVIYRLKAIPLKIPDSVLEALGIVV